MRAGLAALAALLAAVAVLAPAVGAQGGLPGTLTYKSLKASLRLAPGGVVFSLDGVLYNGMDKEVVPGYGYVRISAVKQRYLLGILPSGEERARLTVSSVKVLVDGKPVSYKVEEGPGSVVIKYDVWRPIPPGGSVRVQLSFKAEGLVVDGILFREYSVSLGFPHESVERLSLETSAQGGWLCYASPGATSVYENLKPGSTVSLRAEVSKYLPLPLLPVRGSLAVWGLVALLGVLVAAYRFFKR